MLKNPRPPPAPRWPLADWPAWGWGWVAVVVGARLPVLGHAATAASELNRLHESCVQLRRPVL